MYSSVVLASFLFGAAFVRADPLPTTPAPGDKFNEGADCTVAWNADTSGEWTVMNVELMTGDNEQMQFLELVATVDGTDASNSSITYTCPDVDLNSQVYFYQFTSPYSTKVYWTGRFAIAAADGSTTPAPETELSGGATISWGSGSIIGQTPATAPAYGESAGGASASASGASATVSASASSGSVSGRAPSSSTPESTSFSGPPLTAAAASSSPSASGMVKSAASNSGSASSTETGSPSNGAGALKADGLVLRAGAALILAALTFTVAL